MKKQQIKQIYSHWVLSCVYINVWSNITKRQIMRILYLLIIIILLSCRNQTLELKDIEKEVNDSITEKLILNEESLLEEIIHLYQKDIALKGLKNKNDYKIIISIIDMVEAQGAFDIIDSSLHSNAKEIRKKLDRINFYDSKDLNFKFLHRTINPIVNKYEDFYDTFKNEDLIKDLIYNIGMTNLDTIDISYTLYLSGLKMNLNREKISKDCYFNIVLLTTYGNFIYYSTE